MTDRVGGFVVVLSTDLREDDAEGIRDAICRIRGVLTVKNIEAETNIPLTRLKYELTQELIAWVDKR